MNGGVPYRKPGRTPTRRIPRALVAGLLVVVIAAIATARSSQSRAPSSSTAASPSDVPRSELATRAPEPLRSPSLTFPEALARAQLPRANHGGALGAADGVVPDGTTVFDDQIPGVANLDPALLGALRRAAKDAAHDGITFYVDSGWRSAKYQQQLLQEAVTTYGSEKEAARWVATPSTSPHVSGDAIDIGAFDATAWLSKYGAKYGLCQIYLNERWHYELRPKAIDHGCPPMYADPTKDPRMQP